MKTCSYNTHIIEHVVIICVQDFLTRFTFFTVNVNLLCIRITDVVFQVVGTALLMICILAIFDRNNMHPSNGLIPLALGAMLTVLVMSFGVNYACAINPARDLAPRIFLAIAGWGTETFR